MCRQRKRGVAKIRDSISLGPEHKPLRKKISLKLNLQKVFVGAQQWCALYLWHELQSEALVRSQVKQRPNCPFVRFAVPLPNKTPHLPPIFRIEHRNGQRSGPRRQHSSAERPLFAWLLPIIWKNRLVPRNKSAHQDQVAVIIEVHAHNQTPHLPPIFRIEHRNGQRSGPRRQHSSAERPLFAWLLCERW